MLGASGVRTSRQCGVILASKLISAIVAKTTTAKKPNLSGSTFAYYFPVNYKSLYSTKTNSQRKS